MSVCVCGQRQRWGLCLSHCCALQVRQQLRVVTECVQSKEDVQPGQVRLGNVAALLCVVWRKENFKLRLLLMLVLVSVACVLHEGGVCFWSKSCCTGASSWATLGIGMCRFIVCTTRFIKNRFNRQTLIRHHFISENAIGTCLS